MDEPSTCSVCGQPLQHLKHPVAHNQRFSWDAEVRTCPRNIHREDHYGDPRHDEWHHCEQGWVRREP